MMKSPSTPPNPSNTRAHVRVKRYCSDCNRAVQDTIHTSKTYYVDWYLLGGKVICRDCKKT